MVKYHVNPETGRPNICRAKTPEACRFAKDGETVPHYNTKADARAGYEKEQERNLVRSVSSRTFNAHNPGVSEGTRKDVENMARRGLSISSVANVQEVGASNMSVSHVDVIGDSPKEKGVTIQGLLGNFGHPF